MTAALGWINADMPVPTGCCLRRKGPVALVVAQQIKRERVCFLQAQCECAETVESFLPASFGLGYNVARSLHLTVSQAQPLVERLAALKGQAQVSLSICLKQAAAHTSGGSWLRRRCAHWQAVAALEQTLRERLEEMMRAFTSPDMVLRRKTDRIEADLLAQRTDITGLLALLRATLPEIGHLGLPVRNCAVAGPLPVYGFAGLPIGVASDG